MTRDKAKLKVAENAQKRADNIERARGRRSHPEIMWLAGLLEGEGSFTRQIQYPKRGRPEGYPRREISTVSTDLDTVQRAAAIMGAKVTGPYKQTNPRWKPYWNVRLPRAAEVPELAALLFPHMGARRQQQILEMLA